jgi:hypothetical protein
MKKTFFALLLLAGTAFSQENKLIAILKSDAPLKGKTDAAEKVRRYENRPAEELYDIVKDQYEWNNLADDPNYAKVKKQLREKLHKWMAQQGDKGQATEMEAFETRGNSLGKKIKIGKRIKSKVAKASFCCTHRIMYSN